MGKEAHPHINPNVISRNGEWFNRKNGIGFFDPNYRNRKNNICETPEQTHWLVEETEQLWSSIMSSPESLLIAGDLGDGKSALIYGLRATFRKNGQPYVYIDGHFQESHEVQLKAGMLWAKKNNVPFFWDSLDYLIVQSKKMRKKSIQYHQKRSSYVLDELMQFISEGGQVIGTTHTSPWISSYCNAHFTNGKWEVLLKSMRNYKVIGSLKSQEIYDFYITAHFTPAMATILSGLTTQEGFAKCRQIIQTDEILAHREEELVNALSKYKTAKLLALATDNQSNEMRILLRKCTEEQIDEAVFLKNLFEYILYENMITLKKNGTLKPRN